MGYIYKKTIVKTGKSYIGRHNGNRKSYKGSGKYYLRDYKKYVKNPTVDVKTEILEQVDDLTKISDREEYWIKHFDAFNNDQYYNLTESGKGNIMCSNEEFSKMMSKIKKGQPSCRKGIKLTKETKEKISKSKIGTPAWNKGKPCHWSQKSNKSILQYTLDGHLIKRWVSMKDASNTLGFDYVSISDCCRNKNKSSNNFLWVFEEGFSEEKLKNKVHSVKNKWDRIKKKVAKINPNTGDVIHVYNSCTDASLGSGVSESMIRLCLSGKKLKTKGYGWRHHI